MEYCIRAECRLSPCFSVAGKDIPFPRASENLRKKDKSGGARLRQHWIDVGKTRNSLDPGSSRVAVVVHAINQPIDFSAPPYPREKLLPSSRPHRWKNGGSRAHERLGERWASGCPRNGKKFRPRLGRERRDRPGTLFSSLIESTCRLCFPRKNRLRSDRARAVKREKKSGGRRENGSSFIRERKNRLSFASYLDLLSSKERTRARLINGGVHRYAHPSESKYNL